ncbi:MAG TPA: GGDEF domain-containing protein [Roseiarcus sp.]|nr:GGDEF domain-containing protein [Roseiarcus sp.]
MRTFEAPDLIDRVAALIDVRNKDDLELTLARVMFDFVGASRLVVWRVSLHEGEVTLQERVRLSETGSIDGQDAALAHAPLRHMDAKLQTTFHTKSDVSGRGGEGAMRYVYPVLDSGDVVGLLEIERRTCFDNGHDRLVRGLIRIYRSHLGILDDTDTDELTGLSNRKPFEEAFRRVMVANARPGSTMDPGVGQSAKEFAPRAEIAVIDIDFFKRVNDRFGHAYGDEVLVLLARLMRSCFRGTDRLYRFGGEEFVVLLQGADSAGADRALERFRKAVEAHDFPQVGRVTVSIGVSAVREGDAGSCAFGRADQALYAAKHNGRNQIQRYETLVPAAALGEAPDVAQEIELF